MCGENNFNYCSEECMKENLTILLERIVSESDMTQRMYLKNNIIKIIDHLHSLKNI